jgi:hypothetical protein
LRVPAMTLNDFFTEVFIMRYIVLP